MNEKLSFQNIIDKLAQGSGVSKKMAETFSKAFFETIIEVLSTGESIKIKGLGTFKLVEVGDRESVNVSTGMRIVIPGYKKVAFTAEDSVVEELNAQTESAVRTEIIGHTESTDGAEKESEKSVVENKKDAVVEEKEVAVSEKTPDIETLIQVPEPEQVEKPQDSFAGIDMLISTPESVEDVRQQYEEAKAKMEAAVEEARKANAEKLRLEKLLERLEKNVEPEVVAQTNLTAEVVHIDEEDSTEKQESPERVVAVRNEEKTEEEKRQEAFNRVMVEQPKPQEPEPQEEQPSKKNVWFTILIVLLVAVLGVFVFLIYRNIEAVEQVPTTTTQPAKPSKPIAKPTKPSKPSTKPVAPKVDKDSLAKAQKADSIKNVKPEKETPKPETSKVKEEPKPERPKTHVMQRGESLTRISQKYYGTKDSVRAILRINTFANPDNIPVGAVVKLP